MGEITIEERYVLAWYAGLSADQQHAVQAALSALAAGGPARLDPSVVHLFRRDLEQLLEVASPQRREQP